MDMSIFNETTTAAEIIRDGIPSRRTSENPPFKDTILIPNPGYVRVRFRADNPGFWLGHCHFDWHLAIGVKNFLLFKLKTKFLRLDYRNGSNFSSW